MEERPCSKAEGEAFASFPEQRDRCGHPTANGQGQQAPLFQRPGYRRKVHNTSVQQPTATGRRGRGSLQSPGGCRASSSHFLRETGMRGEISQLSNRLAVNSKCLIMVQTKENMSENTSNRKSMDRSSKTRSLHTLRVQAAAWRGWAFPGF